MSKILILNINLNVAMNGFFTVDYLQYLIENKSRMDRQQFELTYRQVFNIIIQKLDLMAKSPEKLLKLLKHLILLRYLKNR